MTEAPNFLHRPPPIPARPSEAIQEAPGGDRPGLAAVPPLPAGSGSLETMLADAEAKAQLALRETTITSVSAVVEMGGIKFRLAWSRPRKWWQF